MAVALHKTVRELRSSLTTTEMEHWMALMGMYPIGEEAMDLRFGSITSVLQSGIGTVQLKRGRQVKIQGIFDREFWTKPMSTRALSAKIMSVFKSMGMKVDEDG